jgi:hypothetical protein
MSAVMSSRNSGAGYFGEQGEDGAAVPQHRLGRLVFWHGSFVVNMWWFRG